MRFRTIKWLGALLVAAVMASGCTFEEDEDGHVIVRYDFKNTVGPEGFTCATVAIATIEVTVTNLDTGERYAPVVAPCSDGMNSLVHIGGLSTGRINIVTRFLNGRGQEVAKIDDQFNPSDPQAPVIRCQGDVSGCRFDTVYSVNATGDFDFTTDLGSRDGMNCSPLGVMMSNRQKLFVSNSTDMPITIRLVIPQITPGPPGMEYPPGAPERCIENGVTQTMINHFIGYYSMRVIGEANSNPPLVCYDSLPLPFRITSVKGARTVFTAPITPAGMGQAPCNAT